MVWLKMEQTHTHMFNGRFSDTTSVSQYHTGKTNLDFTEARDSEWEWHHLGQMQVCTSLQTDNNASIPPLLPDQQRQSTEGNQKTGLLVFLAGQQLKKQSCYGIQNQCWNLDFFRVCPSSKPRFSPVSEGFPVHLYADWYVSIQANVTIDNNMLF